ncbi:MAG: nitric oxide reductase activation protein [Pseudomonadota bacterium]|nr:nitric oxide reductase activation protein [Pseudomonadota bacterium]
MLSDSNPAPPLPAGQLELRLNTLLEVELSYRATEPCAAELSRLTREQQDFVLHWVDVIGRSNTEMGYQFALHAADAFRRMESEGVRQWVLQAMDIYDRRGLYPGSTAFRNVETFAARRALDAVAVPLQEVRGMLALFIRGLAGRELKIEPGPALYTDTEILYLPSQINHFDSREQNYRLYKVMAVQLWAQVWFGTFRRSAPDAPHLGKRLAAFDDPRRALQLFLLLESIRLNACVARELPGLGRESATLDAQPPATDPLWRRETAALEAPDATVETTLEALDALYHLDASWPDPSHWQGELRLGEVEAAIAQRLEREREILKRSLRDLQEDAASRPNSPPTEPEKSKGKFELAPETEPGAAPELTLDGQPVAPPPDVRNLITSILQDLDRLPEEFLVPAGDGQYDTGAGGTGRHGAETGPERNESGALLYDEWDHHRQNYRKNWCVLRELETRAVYDDFVDETLARYHWLIGEIRRGFEALRGEDKLLKRQTEGDDIDLDALVEAHADMQTGAEMTNRLFTRMHKIDRDLAVVFMVDVSGSTKGWINDAERESLILLCEALEILGDRYAIYGFSGMTRNRCEVYRIKRFDEPYGREIKARISGLSPRDYTRMGVTIRHLTRLLSAVEAKTRMLITLSDGKPDDWDGYRGEYGIEDTRQALLEARHAGIHPFCITIDTEAKEYLPHMYGPVSYVVINEVRKLPLKVADIYRRLTA